MSGSRRTQYSPNVALPQPERAGAAPEAEAVEQDDVREEETDRGGIVNEGDTSEVGRAWAIVEIQEDEVARLRAVVDAALNWRDERDSKADSALIDALSTYDRFAPEPKP